MSRVKLGTKGTCSRSACYGIIWRKIWTRAFRQISENLFKLFLSYSMAVITILFSFNARVRWSVLFWLLNINYQQNKIRDVIITWNKRKWKSGLRDRKRFRPHQNPNVSKSSNFRNKLLRNRRWPEHQLSYETNLWIKKLWSFYSWSSVGKHLSSINWLVLKSWSLFTYKCFASQPPANPKSF